MINRSFQGVEYKLSATATPAPNDTIEFVSQAVFLEKIRTDLDIIWSYFERDEKSHRRTVKPHARAAFFDFMAAWSIYLKEPKRFGWRLELPDVPEPEYFNHELPVTPEQTAAAREVLGGDAADSLFVVRETNAIERTKLAQIARGFVYRKGKNGASRTATRIESRKPRFIAELAASEVAAGHQVLVWTTFDEESSILADLLKGSPFGWDLLTGATPDDDRQRMLERFADGGSSVLIGRPRMLGYGLNFQHCSSMIFSAISESFEDLYQAIRRAVRHGQTKRVRVHYPFVEELEGSTFANLARKAARHERDSAEMEDNYLRAWNALYRGIA